MRAMSYGSFGGAEALSLVDVPPPTPGPGQLLVKVSATSVNPIDWKMASGKLRLFLPVKFPAVPGFDVSGRVAALGPGVGGLTLGQHVHARIAASPGGASAELALVEAEQAVAIHHKMSDAEAAALPLAGMTALQGLRAGGLPPSGATARVLIVGASGGVGHLALQIARAAGAQVTGVCSGRNEATVRGLGADDVIDYTNPEAWAGKGPWDIVYDCVGGDAGPWYRHLAAGGHYLTCVPAPATFLALASAPLRRVKVTAVLLKPNGPDLRTLDALHEAGRLRVLVDSTYPLSELPKAWDRSKSGRAVGKIVVTVG